MTMNTTLHTMRYGQHAITAVLIVIGVIRALGDGLSPVLVVAASVVFAGWYALGFSRAERDGGKPFATLWLIILALLWLGLTAVSSEFLWLAFPLWLLAGHLLSLRTALIFSVLTFAVVIVVPVRADGQISYAAIIGPLVGAIFSLGIARGYLQLQRDAEERHELITALVHAHEDLAGLHDELGRTQRESGAVEERTRISRDIHDTIAQGLSAIVLIARAEEAPDAPDQDDDHTALRQIETLALENLIDVRRIVAALSPADLHERALAGAIRRLLDRLTAETGIETELHADESFPTLPAVVEVALLRTVQSALANVRLHSRATRAVITLVDDGDSIRLDIVDNGNGFDLGSWPPEASLDQASGYGLLSMRGRLRELGGGLEIESALGEGTALSVFLPVGQPVPQRQDQR